MHVDMDAFFASVALRDRPELSATPVAVGGDGARGVVMAANYPARECGVRSGIPMGRARRLCPRLVVISAEEDEVAAVSVSVMEVLRSVAPVVEVVSVDEAYLDVSRALRGSTTALDLAATIRARVRDEQQIACSVGIAAGRRIAKVASRRAKPDGVLQVTPSETVAFLHPLAVDELPGVGERTGSRLRALGLYTVADLAHMPRSTLCRVLGQQLGSSLHDLSWGSDPGPVVSRGGPDERGASMGADETFARDADDPTMIRRELLRLSARVTARMRAADVRGRTVVLRVRFADRTTITRTCTLRDDTAVAQEVYDTAAQLYDALGLQRARIRLVGVRVEGLVPSERARRQLVLGAREHGWEQADHAVDRATARFGRDIVHPAALLTASPRQRPPGPHA